MSPAVFCRLPLPLAVLVSGHGRLQSLFSPGCEVQLHPWTGPCSLQLGDDLPLCPVGLQLSRSRLTDTWPGAEYLHRSKVLKWCQARWQVEFTRTATVGGYGLWLEQSSSASPGSPASGLVMCAGTLSSWANLHDLSSVLAVTWSIRGTCLYWCQPPQPTRRPGLASA